MTATDPLVEATPRPMIFLLGPPGAGKTVFGGRACRELGLRFRDLADARVAVPADAGDLDRLSRLVGDRAADVFELPWPLQQERKTLALVRRSGVPLLLWAHPEEETPDFRDLATTLQFRLVRAFEHWRGNTHLTLAAIIRRTVEQHMRAQGQRGQGT